jgi:hypothetical protein
MHYKKANGGFMVKINEKLLKTTKYDPFIEATLQYERAANKLDLEPWI